MDGTAYQLIGSILGTGVVATVVGALINRRKLSAETIEVIDRAAGSAVKRTEEDNSRLREEARAAREDARAARQEAAEGREENGQLWAKTRQLEHENATLIDVIRDQLAYSRRLAGVVRALGGDVPDPPGLPAALLGDSQGRGTQG